jgi:negative regulator of sigma-B (phosphoserine phosphatase)
MENQSIAPSCIDWGAAAAAQPGQVVSGDRFVVAPFPQGVLVAVVDGLGHGEQAAAAAEVAAATLQAHASEPVIPLVRRCHDALARTRGAVLTLASLNGSDNTMTWLGVGNVEGVLLRGESVEPRDAERILLRGGVVGYQLPPLRASALSLARGDTLILVTDGIKGTFADNLLLADPPQHIADRILARGNKKMDDALVLVVRYLGGAA